MVTFCDKPIKLFEIFAAECARVHQMACVYTPPNSRLDDDARRLTQDYPAFGENLSRASSRSSNAATNTSRSAYPGVPEDILDHIDEARAARDRALANWNAARQDPGVTQAQEVERGHKPSKTADKLKLSPSLLALSPLPPNLEEHNSARSKHDRAKLLGQHVGPGWSALLPLLTRSPLPLGVEDSDPSLLEQGEKLKKPTLDLDRGVHFKTGEEVGIVVGGEEGTKSVHDSYRAHLPGLYEHNCRSTTLAVPLGREQLYVQDVSRTVNRPALQYEIPLALTRQQRDEPESDEQHKLRIKTARNHLNPRWCTQPKGFGGDSEGSSYGSSESDYGGRNGGGGRPGWGDDDPGNPDHNDGGQSDDHQPRRGRHGDNEPRRGPCGGGPPGGDPPDDGEPEGGRYGNSKRSNRKDSKKRRGVTPFSEEGSPHYGYEYFEYKGEPPTSLKIPLKEKVFTQFATLIEWRLFTKMQVMGDSKAQRNLINSIPKIKQYNGQNSIVVLDNFLRGLIRHMEIQGLTGPPKIKDREGTSVVTNEDAGRTILMDGNLSEAALEWYQTYAERPPDSFKQGMKASAHRRTFLQIFRALFDRFFDRFITGAALKIDALYNKAKYTMLGGARQLFSDMKMYAEMMPVPPDEYQFKDDLLEELPQSMRRIVLNDGLGPNTATIDEIMHQKQTQEESSSLKRLKNRESLSLKRLKSRENLEVPDNLTSLSRSPGCTDKRYAGDDQSAFYLLH
ncbi:hypothetical protein K435DRAFT_876881 [Dendrothele bispora CBS 962.96]|uniref:Uncharacterized protein n=1 Tax=Dendrothele bispora (strain CBS 962.96) TaxID=1314807 RepID=A0A4S8KR44_DENBC|nr:hypothetical protein K435DRAFT_876881 [Dendrothele bispora CBS 962.96]